MIGEQLKRMDAIRVLTPDGLLAAYAGSGLVFYRARHPEASPYHPDILQLDIPTWLRTWSHTTDLTPFLLTRDEAASWGDIPPRLELAEFGHWLLDGMQTYYVSPSLERIAELHHTRQKVVREQWQGTPSLSDFQPYETTPSTKPSPVATIELPDHLYGHHTTHD